MAITMRALEAAVREGGTPRQVRRAGDVPAVVYGPNVEPVAIRVPLTELVRLLDEGGRRGLIQLRLQDAPDEPRTVMVKDLQFDALGDRLLHIDFYQVDMSERLRTTVRLEFAGEAYATREGGVMQYTTRELDIECLPTNIPEVLAVDVAHLGIGESVTVGDLTPPADAVFLDEPETVVATLVLPRTEVEPEEEPVAAELLEPELIGEEDEEGAAAEPEEVEEEERA